MTQRRVENPRLLTEGIAAVASILIAFSLDAWWDQRGARERLKSELQNVDEELAANVRLIAFEFDFMSRVIRGIDALVELKGADPQALVADTLVWLATMSSPTLDMSLGAVDALLASGGHAAIEAADLRIALAGLRDRATDVRVEQLVARGITLESSTRLDGTGVLLVSSFVLRFLPGSSETSPG